MGGISGILGTFAFLGILLFVAGIGLAVMSASQGRPVRGGVMLAIIGGVAAAIFGFISSGVLIVQREEVAIVFNTLSGDLGEPRGPGTHIIIPVLQEAQIYSVAFNTYTQGVNSSGSEGPIAARTSDGQEVLIEVSVVYRVNPDEVNIVRDRWQQRYVEELIIPVLRGFIRDVVSGYRAEGVYSTDREVIQQRIEQLMRDRLATEGLELSDIIIRDVSFSNEDFARSIEQVQIAEREAQEASQAAERARIQARGERDAAITRAEGDAESAILRAEAQAQALRLVSEQIAANPNLIQYEYIRNLSDNVRMILVPSNSPFLFDFESLGSASPDFSAPPVPESILPSLETTPEAPDN